MRRPSFLPLALAVSLFATARAEAAEASLTVVFKEIVTPSGAIRAVLYDSEAAYRSRSTPVRVLTLPVTGATVQAQVADLPPGRYAISAFHDADGDGKLKTNAFGVPQEAFAFSNGARAQMGPPGWEAAAFAVVAGQNTQTLVLDSSFVPPS
ncbi:MAG: DUF2141 domain-containing protein [Phenylobacterium sp.]|uniref:DUF2141 domain-containing protein n=1 Tax=Phenylobacterium sp. TaxID=1871053 RepID=UPI001A592980|nr:DUF2141 domain-containing protein [Phenylobacterium sp.]MBL8772609.1 DUF2141 domain-containing protein [Phenylobacterium sp.]